MHKKKEKNRIQNQDSRCGKKNNLNGNLIIIIYLLIDNDREHDAWKAKLAAKAEHKVQLRKEKEQRDQEKQRRFLKANPQLAQ